MKIRHFILLLMAASASSAEPLTLDEALLKAQSNHPEITAANANYEAEKSTVRSQQWLKDPMIGVMYEKNMNMMQQQMGAMTSLSISQDIEFPAKYWLRGQFQEKRASQAKEALGQSKLAVRKRVITTYFQLYANQHIRELINVQKDTVRQIARIAESRHSIGAVSQQDEMKAHVEQSAVANEHFAVEQEEEALQKKLALLLGYESSQRFSLPKEALAVPELRLPENLDEIALNGSRRLKQDEIRLQVANVQKRLALFDYAPDFRISAQTMVGPNRPDDNFAFAFDFSVPLWFLMRQTSEVQSASAREREAKYAVEATKRELFSEAQDIAAKIRKHSNFLKVFSTTLIPQATSTFNASRSAYQAGQTSFLELLDSARTIFTVRVTYYQHLAEYVEQIAILEELIGASVSSLPFGDNS